MGEGSYTINVTPRVLNEQGFSAASSPSLPRPLSPTSLPSAGREGRLQESFFQFLLAVLPLLPAEGREAGRRGLG